MEIMRLSSNFAASLHSTTLQVSKEIKVGENLLLKYSCASTAFSASTKLFAIQNTNLEIREVAEKDSVPFRNRLGIDHQRIE